MCYFFWSRKTAWCSSEFQPHAKEQLLLLTAVRRQSRRGFIFFRYLQRQSGYLCGWIGLGWGRGVSDSCAKPCGANTITLIHYNIHLFTNTHLPPRVTRSHGCRISRWPRSSTVSVCFLITSSYASKNLTSTANANLATEI